MRRVVRYRRGRMLAFWAGIGILFVTVAVNRLFASGLVNYRVLYGWLEQRLETEIPGTFAVLRILFLRGLQTAAVVALCSGGFRQFFVRMIPAVMGGGASGIIVLLTWSRGAVGLPLALALWLPHGLLYLAVWAALLLRLSSGERLRERRFLSAVWALFLAGILLEILINPWILRVF